MRAAKAQLRSCLQSEDWRSHLPEIAEAGTTSVGPLFSFLLLDPCMMHRAAVALGHTCAVLACHEPEKARNVVRRYMWHLSEESGNIGWGIPQAFAETLVESPLLAKEFHRILITYVIDLGKEDNYCDNGLLRRSCYWACGRFCGAKPEWCLTWREWLLKGLRDVDIPCRGYAAWALGQLPGDFMDQPLLRELAQAEFHEECILFDGHTTYTKTVSELALEAMAKEPR